MSQLSDGRSTLSAMAPVRRSAPSLLAVVLVVLTAAGCGSGVKPATWAKSVCTALAPWRAKLDSLTADTQTQLTSATTPAQAKDKLVGLLDGAEQASETARDRVAGAGTPDVDGGDRIASRFEASLTSARDAYGHAKTTVAALDTGDEKAFYAAVQAAFEKLQTEYAASALDTDKIASGPLRKAFNEVPECH
jgi:hypothetical protein